MRVWAAFLMTVLVSGCPVEPPVQVLGVQRHVEIYSQRDTREDTTTTWVGPRLVGNPATLYFGEEPILEGSQACVAWSSSWDDADEPADCWAVTLTDVTGSREIESPICLVLVAGLTTLDFAGQSCGGDTPTDLDDQIVLTGLTQDQTRARLSPWPEITALAGDLEVLSSGDLPADLGVPYGERLLVAGGEPVRFDAHLTTNSDTIEWAAWNRPLTALEVRPVSGEVAQPDSAPLASFGIAQFSQPLLDRGVRAQLEVGAVAEVLVRHGESSWSAGTLTGVDALEEARSLEIVAAAVEVGNFGARAFVRDEAGSIIHGAPVTWSFAGLSMALAVANDKQEVWAGADYVNVADVCTAPSKRVGLRSGTLRARFGDLSAELPLEWENLEASDRDWERSPLCRPPGCSGCAQGSRLDAQTPGWALFVLLGLGRRRRLRGSG